MKYARELTLLALLVLVVLASIYFPLNLFLETIQAWSASNPYLAAGIVGVLFVICGLLILPVSPVAMVAGFFFGVYKGLLLIWVFGAIGSVLAFWIARTMARPWVASKLEEYPKLVAIDKAVDIAGLRVVLAVRLAMVFPYAPVNYSLGLSKIRLRDFVVGTNIGMIPGYLLVVYLGTLADDVTAILAGDMPFQASDLLSGLPFLIGLVIVLTLIVRSSMKTLKSELARIEQDNNGPEIQEP